MTNVLGTVHLQGVSASRVFIVTDTMVRLGWTPQDLDPDDHPDQLCFTQLFESEENRVAAVTHVGVELPDVLIVFGGGQAPLDP